MISSESKVKKKMKVIMIILNKSHIISHSVIGKMKKSKCIGGLQHKETFMPCGSKKWKCQMVQKP